MSERCSSCRTLAAFLITSWAAIVHAEAPNPPAVYQGKAVRIGNGLAHTVVRSDADGKARSVGVLFTAGVLDGLPDGGKRKRADFPFLLPMPSKGPRTVVDHVVIDWEAVGHAPPKVYDVPHFDFHFYLVSGAERSKISFKSEKDSGHPSQQPPAELLPAGYIIPPGTAAPKMGVHAINPNAPEFQGQPFSATFIYGYYNKQLTFLEPMASLSFLKSKPNFSAEVPRPATYTRRGTYPGTYSVKYDVARDVYEVTLEDFR